ncbi:hypothetical protein D9756_006987 [Leucocoprinus leucothites]|uniref:DUF300-domain-containing protein n=1 Tax=Leucocoprinus leucothites TaxID=201217 RepID=A0A8H5FYU2_9AGAR|nr:hypothetical protein D9756_006987 [Leucoagaricus leucothites]
MATKTDVGSGFGSRLPTAVLVLAGISTLVAVFVSTMSIVFQLKNYRKPILQRMVVRIMVMVPLYAISSLISLFSVEAAFVIDAIRDIYEAFVIYCFFELLLGYLGGERSLLIMLHGRPPKEHAFPISIFKREIDVSDPYTFLFLKRGILQYVQVKPILAAATLILKAVGKYNDGNFRANSGYLYVSIVYNTSICLALYCLAMFWVCVNDDLKPFRPVPKFLCVKGILFFSFWQSIGISILVAAQVISRLGPYKDAEHISVGLNDSLICLEMPFFAIAHNYAFSYKDFIDSKISYVARMPFYYAFRDAFGLRDVIEDSKTTLRGEGMDYREFEPAEGFMHQGVGRDRRIRAGLRYSKGGQRKYWLPKTTAEPPGRGERAVNRAIARVAGRDQTEEVHAPLLPSQARSVVHLAPDMQPDEEHNIWEGGVEDAEDGYELPFGDLDDAIEELFEHSKKYIFGDYNYPCIDVSSEQAREVMWSEEERVLRDERGAWFSPIRGAKGKLALQGRERPAWEGYGAVGTTVQQRRNGGSDDYLTIGDAGHEPVIDHDQVDLQLDPEGPNDSHSTNVKLHWTKGRSADAVSPAKTQMHPPKSHQSKTKSRQRGFGHVADTGVPKETSSAGPSSAGSSSPSLGIPGSSNTNRVRSPPTLSRNTSRGTHRGSHGSSPILPSDAVDLVVEDNTAAEKEQARERRKGEPAMRGPGLKKVYRRGFEAQTPKGEVAKGEVEVEDTDPDRRRVELGEQVLEEVQHDVRRDEPPESQVWEPDNPEGVVARAQTPPLHARMSENNLDDLPVHDNPWA